MFILNLKTEMVYTLLRKLFSVIDRVIYWLIEVAYSIFRDLTEISIVGDETLKKLTYRVWFIIGIFVLFKVAISLINMFANPESFTNEKTGVGNIVKRVLLSLILIVIIPNLFGFAFTLQRRIMDSNIINSLVLGIPTGKNDDKLDYNKNAGKYIAFDIMAACMTPNENKSIFDSSYETKYLEAIKNKDINYFYDNVTSSNNGEYVFDYKTLLTSVIGAGAAYLFILYALDIAIRSVKLSFLQLIAPIPILLYISPKDGDSKLKTWVTEVVSTFMLLFIKIFVISFAIFIIKELANGIYMYDKNGMPTMPYDGGMKPLLFLFIILGILSFANKLPELIGKLLGIKVDDGGGFNLMKKLGAVPLLGGAVVGAMGAAGFGAKMAAGALAGNAIGATSKAIGFGKFSNNIREQFEKSTIGGMAINASRNMTPILTAMGTRFGQGVKGDKKAVQESYNKAEAYRRAQKAFDYKTINNGKAPDYTNRKTYKNLGYTNEDFITARVEINNLKAEKKTHEVELSVANKELKVAEVFQDKDAIKVAMTNIDNLNESIKTAEKGITSLENALKNSNDAAITMENNIFLATEQATSSIEAQKKFDDARKKYYQNSNSNQTNTGAGQNPIP